MIYSSFKTLSDKLNEYLKGIYNTPEDMVVVAAVGQDTGLDSAENQNRIVLSLLNIERETSMGIAPSYRSRSDKTVSLNTSPWHLNLYFIASAIYTDKQYLQSLKVLSSVIKFFQSKNVYFISDKNIKITIESVNVNYQELTNLWSVMGGHYYPSVVGKIRMLTIDSEEVSGVRHVNENVKPELHKNE
ncbi:MAG: DUF4255 domain-containing protein [Bacteroidales bacterium]|jgi:hypothetical protein|nr:DUF4255 domain-containing protein [Bacteroidales bacterium]